MRKKVLMNLLVVSILSCSVMGCGGSETKNEETPVKVEEAIEDSEKMQDNQTDIADNEETTDEEIIMDEPQEESEPEVEQRENTDFRNTCWGDSIEDVKKYETEAEYMGEEDEALLYSSTLNGHKVYVVYYFKNGKLYQGLYGLNENLTTGGQYIEVLNSYKDSLTKKYGEPNPETSGMVKYVDDLQIELAGEGDALKYGYTAYKYEWATDTTFIRLAAVAEDYKINFVLVYYDINYDSSEEEMNNF